MFATFICENCNNKIIVDFNNSKLAPKHCPNCNIEFSSYEYISDFPDKFSYLERALHDLKFCGLSSGQSDYIYENDLEKLNKLYIHSSQEVKEVIAHILDLNFLIILNSDIESMKKFKNDLSAIFKKKIADDNDKLSKSFKSL